MDLLLHTFYQQQLKKMANINFGMHSCTHLLLQFFMSGSLKQHGLAMH